MIIKVICWNLRNFSYSKSRKLTIGSAIAKIFQEVDVGFVLEASADVNDADAAAKELAGNIGNKCKNWAYCVINCGGLGNEEESVIIVYNQQAGISIKKSFILSDDLGDSSVRKPVLAIVSKTEGSKEETIGIAVWHAPPPGQKDSIRAGAWRKILKALEQRNDNDIDYIMGDFNAMMTTSQSKRNPDKFKIISKDIGGTTLRNPANIHVNCLTDIITDSSYDHIYATTDGEKMKEKYGCRVSKYPDLKISSLPATRKRKADRISESKDPHVAYEMSDHLPVYLEIDTSKR